MCVFHRERNPEDYDKSGGVIRDDLDDDIPANIEPGRHTAASITTASVPGDDDRWSTDETAHNDSDSEIIANIFFFFFFFFFFAML